MAAIRIGGFRGLATFPLRIAIDGGHMASRGIEAELSFTASSDALMESLIAGELHVIQASPDNVIAWRDRSGAPIRVWYGGSSGPISLVLAQGVASVEELRGGSVAVDYPNTGWAPIMLRILAAHGITSGDVEQVPFGATAKVFAALTEGRAPAGMLNEPWATRARGRGCSVVDDHRSVAPEMATSAGASLEPWLRVDPERAAGFLKGIIAATGWIRSSSRRTVVAALADHLDASQVEAATLLDSFLDPNGGWPIDARPDPAGITALIDLRAASMAVASRDPFSYVTLEVYERAIGTRD